MGKETDIEWSDSTVNGQMGCDGCELWAPALGVKICYAGTLTERYAGTSKGFPESFNKPKIFPGRIETACKWKDLTGTDRPEKPWLNGYPRAIFLDDMGDTFTESLPLDWLAPYVEQMEASPHIWQILTKRPRRMFKFFHDLGRVPSNFWLGVSVIDPRAFRGRLDAMLAIRWAFPNAKLFASWEPVTAPLPWCREDLEALNWLIFGGASGANAAPCTVGIIESALHSCRVVGVAPFVKQLGSNPVGAGDLKSRKGSDMSEWPACLQVRELPR